jgi:hypothetical protein
MTEQIIKAKKWSKGSDIRFYIKTKTDDGQIHNYALYVTGTNWNAAGGWGTMEKWDGTSEEGEPSAEIQEQLSIATDGYMRSYKQPKTITYTEHDLIDRDGSLATVRCYNSYAEMMADPL